MLRLGDSVTSGVFLMRMTTATMATTGRLRLGLQLVFHVFRRAYSVGMTWMTATFVLAQFGRVLLCLTVRGCWMTDATRATTKVKEDEAQSEAHVVVTVADAAAVAGTAGDDGAHVAESTTRQQRMTVMATLCNIWVPGDIELSHVRSMVRAPSRRSGLTSTTARRTTVGVRMTSSLT